MGVALRLRFPYFRDFANSALFFTSKNSNRFWAPIILYLTRGAAAPSFVKRNGMYVASCGFRGVVREIGKRCAIRPSGYCAFVRTRAFWDLTRTSGRGFWATN